LGREILKYGFDLLDRLLVKKVDLAFVVWPGSSTFFRKADEKKSQRSW
jgi:hypothetical protein